MTALTTLHPTITLDETTPATPTHPWRTGLAAGAVASVATAAFAAVAHALGVSLKVGGEAIPAPGFAQLTFVGAIIGTALAVVLARRAGSPRRTFVRTTVVLTALSIVPDLLVDAQAATKVTLALTHVIAAAIVIPALASRLHD
jgi:hypothetical protein